MDGPGFESWPTLKLCTPKRTAVSEAPTGLMLSGYRTHLSVVKWPGRDADPSPSSRVEVKNVWKFTSTLAFVAWTGTTLIYHFHVRSL